MLQAFQRHQERPVWRSDEEVIAVWRCLHKLTMNINFQILFSGHYFGAVFLLLTLRIRIGVLHQNCSLHSQLSRTSKNTQFDQKRRSYGPVKKLSQFNEMGQRNMPWHVFWPRNFENAVGRHVFRPCFITYGYFCLVLI